MRAIAVRMRRLASRTNLRKTRVTTRMKGRTANAANASFTSSLNSRAAMTTSRKKSLIMVTTPAAKRSFRASTSVVTRVIKRPTGLRS